MYKVKKKYRVPLIDFIKTQRNVELINFNLIKFKYFNIQI
jgi:hypothetical protein